MEEKQNLYYNNSCSCQAFPSIEKRKVSLELGIPVQLPRNSDYNQTLKNDKQLRFPSSLSSIPSEN